MDPKIAFFGHFIKSQQVMFATNYLNDGLIVSVSLIKGIKKVGLLAVKLDFNCLMHPNHNKIEASFCH